MNGQSDTKPNNMIKSRGVTQVLYNIISKEITDEFGTRTIWEYNYVEVDGLVTKRKIVEALQKTDAEEDQSEIIFDNISNEYNDAKSQLSLSDLSHLTYNQLNTYIENNITTLGTAKTYLQKLSMVVLALVKKYND